MNRFLVLLLLLSVPSVILAQTATLTTTGDWDLATNWAGNEIGDNSPVEETVTINASRTTRVRNGFTYTIGDLNMLDFSGLTVDPTGDLNVGQTGVGNNRNVTAGNNVSITVNGTMIIWGNLNVTGDNLTLAVNGNLIIKGNLIMDDAASLTIAGTIHVDGNFIADDNTNVSISSGGHVNVAGTVTIGDNSNLIGDPGSFYAGGGCTQGSGSAFCNQSALPITLAFFNASFEKGMIRLSWGTLSEENFDRFEIERATRDLNFYNVAEVFSAGYNTNKIHNYDFVDETPLPGNNYYRLKTVDRDGSYTYFRMVMVNNPDTENHFNLNVYPNPVSGGLITFTIPFTPTPNDQVSIMDLQGRVINVNTSLVSGENQINLGNALKPGLYLLKYSSSSYQKTAKLVVIN